MARSAALSHRMADKHESDLAELFGGRRTRGSGNQFNGQLDVRMPSGEWGLGLDGKATMHGSASVSVATWAKLVRQSHDLRPALPLRFYEPDERLKIKLDLIVLGLHDFIEIYQRATVFS